MPQTTTPPHATTTPTTRLPQRPDTGGHQGGLDLFDAVSGTFRLVAPEGSR